MGIGVLVFSLVIALAVAVGASRLGYSGLIWFVAQFFGGPFTLGAVSALPDRELERKRVQELAALQAELVNAKRSNDSTAAISDNTIGDQTTIRS